MTFPLPDAAILDDRLAIVGTTGSGKSYMASSAIERVLAAGHRAIIIDPLGVWWGLRLQADGETQSAFSPVIFGGARGDIPITESAGQVIGEAVASMKESCIVDLSEFGTKAAERRFMLAFITALYRNSRGNPVHIVFDEADMWAPQFTADREGGAAQLLGMMETIVRRGRIKGFVPMLITQRPAVLNKNVLSQADGLVAFKLTSSQDRDAIGAWVEGQADKSVWRGIYAKLATMKRGEGVVWLPGREVLETVQFPQKMTFDSSRTPRRGETQSPSQLKPLNIGALRERLATVEDEVKLSDPKLLKAEIARLRAAKPDPEAELRGYERGSQAMLSATSGLLSDIAAHLARADEELAGAKRRVESFATQTQTKSSPAPVARLQAAAPRNPKRSGTMSPSARQIVDVIRRAYPVSLSFAAAARRAGVSNRSSAYRSYQREVEACPDIELQASGNLKCATGTPGLEPTPASASVDSWAARLPKSYGSMLRAIAAEGRADKNTIAIRAGVSPTSSGLSSGLRELVSLELVVVDDGKYSLSEGM
jgi:hypothetical protein